MDMRRPPRIVMIAPGIGAGLDGDEAIAPRVVGHHPARAGEVRVERRVMLVPRVDVAAAGIGLPDLHQGPRHRAAVFVEHAAAHDNALAKRSEEHTSELQSLMRISYAVFCLKQQTTNTK